MKKGITPVISVVLLMLITVILIAAAFIFFTKVFSRSTTSVQTGIESTTGQAQARFAVDNIDINNGVIYIRNLGSTNLSQFTVYVNGQQWGISSNTIQPGSTGSLRLYTTLPAGTDKIKITTSQGVFYTEETVNSVITPFFRMEIESVVGDSDKMIVNTTGATYILNRTGIEMLRKIDPKTNIINPRKVAEIIFDRDVGPLEIISLNKRNAKIDSDVFSLDFNSDSFFFLTAKRPFNYTHKNLIKNSIWNKDSGLDRMWTDGYGGSLHATINSNPRAIMQDTDYTTIEMQTGARMAHMVFPPKKFDFEKLYGKDARPFVYFVFSIPSLTDVSKNFQTYINDSFGVFMVWNRLYDCGGVREECYNPVLLDSGILGYKIKPDYETLIRDFIRQAHSNGFKVIPYFYAPAAPEWKYPQGHPKAGQYQDVNTTLKWMKNFQEEYGFDGWYLDGGADVGDLVEDYDFIRQLRKDVGDDGVIYVHDSVDAWDNNRINWIAKLNYTGLRAVMLDDYADYTLVGETGDMAQINSPNDYYLRFFSSGYGLSQAFGDHKRLSNGKLAISEKEKSRVLDQNLNGISSHPWSEESKPAYERRKTEYLSGNFNPDVDWPIDSVTGWFRTPKNIRVSYTNETSVSISWYTSEDSDGEVSIVNSSKVWWPPEIYTNLEIAAFKIPSKTISFWAKPSADITTTQPVFSDGSANYYVGFANRNNMIFSYANATGKQKTFYVAGVIPNEWHQYSYVFDVSGSSVTMSGYKDGVLLGSRTDSEGYSSLYGSNFIIGAFAPTQFFYNGSLDEAKIWDEALTEGIDPVAYYKFDEGSGTTIADSSGNENTGTINGAVWKSGADCVSGSCLSFDGANDYVSLGKKLQNHVVDITGLRKNENYEFGIRSSNKRAGVDEIIWGYVGNLTAAP